VPNPLPAISMALSRVDKRRSIFIRLKGRHHRAKTAMRSPFFSLYQIGRRVETIGWIRTLPKGWMAACSIHLLSPGPPCYFIFDQI